MSDRVFVDRRRDDQVREARQPATGTTRTWAARPGRRRSPTPASPTARSSRPSLGYCYGDSTCGQRALYELGLTGIPVVNVNNNCSTGSSALYLARQFVQGGMADCVLALGFEKMEKGSLGVKFDRPHVADGQARR